VTVHVADPRRFAAFVLVVVLVAVAVAMLFALGGSEPIPIGRS